MEYLDFPSQGIPFELLDGILAGLNGQISDQFPLDFLSAFRSAALLGMDHRQSQRRISLLFSDRRLDSYLAESDFKNGDAPRSRARMAAGSPVAPAPRTTTSAS